jgi:hypothetical protein
MGDVWVTHTEEQGHFQTARNREALAGTRVLAPPLLAAE